MRHDLPAGVDQHEHDDDRDDADGERMVRDAQAGDEGTDQQVARPSLVAPDQGAVEQQRDEQQMERVHLREGRLFPERPGEGQGERAAIAIAGRTPSRTAISTATPTAAAAAVADKRVRSPGDRGDRDQAERLADQRVERIARRVEDAEARQQELGLGPVTEADAGQERPDVDDGRDREGCEGGKAGRADPLADAVDRRRARVHGRRDGHRLSAPPGCKPPEASTTRYDARSSLVLDRRPHLRHGRGTPVNQAEAWPAAERATKNEAHGGDVVGLALSRRSTCHRNATKAVFDARRSGTASTLVMASPEIEG